MPWTGRTPRARAAAARAKARYIRARAANVIKRAVAKYSKTRRRGEFTIPARKPFFFPYSKFQLASMRKRSYSRYRRR